MEKLLFNLKALLLLITATILFPAFSNAQKITLPKKQDMWVSAYLASYNHFAPPAGNWGNLPTGQIDWNTFTHLFYFSFKVKSNGSLSEIAPYHNMNRDRIQSIVSAAHEAGKPILFTIGGWGNHNQFAKAIGPASRDKLIANVVQLIKNWGFDGVDLDLEPIKDQDLQNFQKFINTLNKKLQAISTHQGNTPLFTIATSSHPKFFAKFYSKFDQINLMTYDMSGAWEGWVSWYNAPVYGSNTFPNSKKPLPSINGTVKQFIAAGVPKSKLGIGIDFYGYVWSGGSGTSTGGVTKPNQSWDHSPSVTENVPYHKIMDQYFSKGSYHWDEKAKAAYLSIDHEGSKNDKFISFDDERAIRAKFKYVQQHNLGGVIIWELSGGYRQKAPSGQRDLLLQQVKNIIRN